MLKELNVYINDIPMTVSFFDEISDNFCRFEAFLSLSDMVFSHLREKKTHKLQRSV